MGGRLKQYEISIRVHQFSNYPRPNLLVGGEGRILSGSPTAAVYFLVYRTLWRGGTKI